MRLNVIVPRFGDDRQMLDTNNVLLVATRAEVEGIRHLQGQDVALVPQTHEALPEQGLESDCASAGTVPDGNETTMHEITGLVQVCMECGRVFIGERQGLGLPCGHGYGVVGAVEDLGKVLTVYRAAIAVAVTDSSGVEESDWPELDTLIELVRG